MIIQKSDNYPSSLNSIQFEKSDSPRGLIYSKAFMSFSLDKKVAMNFMQRKIPSEQTVRVLYILKTEVI